MKFQTPQNSFAHKMQVKCLKSRRTQYLQHYIIFVSVQPTEIHTKSSIEVKKNVQTTEKFSNLILINPQEPPM